LCSWFCDFRVAQATSLLSADAAGAFVVALEDEFWQVLEGPVKEPKEPGERAKRAR